MNSSTFSFLCEKHFLFVMTVNKGFKKCLSLLRPHPQINSKSTFSPTGEIGLGEVSENIGPGGRLDQEGIKKESQTHQQYRDSIFKNRQKISTAVQYRARIKARKFNIYH